MLNYHFHVPAPDPLTSFDGMDRAGFYAEQITDQGMNAIKEWKQLKALNVRGTRIGERGGA